MKRSHLILLTACLALFILGLVLLLILLPAKHSAILARTELPDGRVLQIEGVTFGTHHHMGNRSELVERLGPWLPRKVREFFQPRPPRSDITLDEPGLVVWVNAVDAQTGANVDCQAIRVEFVGEQGDLFGAETCSWFAYDNDFRRVGHVFKSFPRTETNLTFQITPWRAPKGKAKETRRVTFANPFVTKAAAWTGQPLPQSQKIGGLEIMLASLERSTNGSPKDYWETPSIYWKPVWELRRDGAVARGWSEPEWIAEDPLGNRGSHPGIHEPVLRFTATYYPLATNAEAVSLVGALPSVTLDSLSNAAPWNTEISTNRILAIGCFPAGMHTFSEGAYVANPPPNARMGATMGGAPSGWVSSGQRVSPMKMIMWHGHYTPGPVIYLKLLETDSTNRFAVRMKDEQGRTWIAEPESEGASDNIMPYLVRLPPDVKTVVPEIVLLKPIRATFTVATKTEPRP